MRFSLPTLLFAVSLSCVSFAQPMAVSRAPHGFHEEGPPQDSALPDETLQDRTILVRVFDGADAPKAGVKVTLFERYENIADGGKNTERTAISDQNGEVRFANLGNSLRFSYTINAEHSGAKYELEGFRLPEKGGVSARLHVYETTPSERDAFVGMRGFIYIAQREDQFQFDVLYRVVTMSRMTWLPNVELALPKAKKAFDGVRKEGEKGFKETPQGARLVGSFPPGQADARMGFQMDRSGEASQSFDFELPPHVAELRVIAESLPGLTLSVPGFEETQSATGPDGKKVLITRRVMRPGEPDNQRLITVRLGGLPVRSPARWYASALALVVVGLGLWATKRPSASKEAELLEQKAQARRRLLEELRTLEQEHEKGEIGPETFGEAKRQLLLAIARLLPDRETPTKAAS